MVVALSAALLFAQAAAAAPAYGPSDSPPAKTAPAPVKTAERECAPQNPDPKANAIVVCAVKPEGYRIDPDVLAAKRMKKKGDGGPPKNPHETYADHSCATVGPMGCRGGAGFNVVGAAMAAANMIDKAVKGENVAQTLATDPTRSEYQLYKEAKREREEKEANAAAKAISDAAKAKAAVDAKAAADAAQATPSGQPAEAPQPK
jgi:hypothetical protein